MSRITRSISCLFHDLAIAKLLVVISMYVIGVISVQLCLLYI